MATLREYFDVDFNRIFSIHKDWELRGKNGEVVNKIIARVSQDLDANAKYWSFFLEGHEHILHYIHAILQTPETRKCIIDEYGDDLKVMMQSGDYSDMTTSETLVFTNRVFLYINDAINAQQKHEIISLGQSLNYQIILRDKEYALKRSELEKPLAFISHDSSDKDSLVRELAGEMSKLMCPVWYDEYSLNVGDSLRDSIETGLKETKKCIIILSPSFFANEGWGKAEFDSIYTREILQKKNVILPVWHNVKAEDVYDYSPRLADKFGLSSDIGVKELARKLVNAVKKGT